MACDSAFLFSASSIWTSATPSDGWVTRKRPGRSRVVRCSMHVPAGGAQGGDDPFLCQGGIGIGDAPVSALLQRQKFPSSAPCVLPVILLHAPEDEQALVLVVQIVPVGERAQIR